MKTKGSETTRLITVGLFTGGASVVVGAAIGAAIGAVTNDMLASVARGVEAGAAVGSGIVGFFGFREAFRKHKKGHSS